jgi:hypothetical protein
MFARSASMTLQTKTVISPFKATTAISGSDRFFQPGDQIFYETGQTNDQVLIERDGVFYFANRSDIESCCMSKNEGSPFF